MLFKITHTLVMTFQFDFFFFVCMYDFFADVCETRKHYNLPTVKAQKVEESLDVGKDCALKLINWCSQYNGSLRNTTCGYRKKS